jgi:hypothetical protein
MYFKPYHYLKMKLLFFLSFIILTSCTQDPPPIVYGCMDKNSSYYNPTATIDDGSCKYGGSIRIYRNNTGDAGDSLQFWLDSINGSGLRLNNEGLYNSFPIKALPCDDIGNSGFFLHLGKWTYQLKKRLVNGQIIVLTQPKTVDVYNKYCELIEVK